MMAAARVTAIVPARELTEDGRRCLEALSALGRDVEVVFVPDQDTPEVPPGVTCVPSGVAPVGSKRQLGLEHSSGAFIALIDDDAVPHPEWLENLLAPFAEDPQIGAVCGPSITPRDAPELEQLGGRVYASRLVSGPARWRYGFTAARDVDDAPSVNLAFRREDAVAIRFDSPYYPGDDTLVCDRLISRGRRIRYVPAAIVFHRRRPLWRAHLLQVWRFGRHRGTFARTIGGNSARPGYFAPTALVLGLGAGWMVPGRARRWWLRAAGAYALSCIAAGANRDGRRWLRVSIAIPATHVSYGVGFLLGLCGLSLGELGRTRRG